MVTPTFAKSKAAKNADNNVSSSTEQVADHDFKVYGSNYIDGDNSTAWPENWVSTGWFRRTRWRYVSRKPRAPIRESNKYLFGKRLD